MNYLFLFTTFLLITFIIWIIKYLEKKLPERDERIRQKTLSEISVDTKQQHKLNQSNDNTNLYNSLYTKKKSLSYKEKIEKGEKYEAHVANYFKEQGYYVWEHGKEKGRKDGGIDLFIKKGNETYFVQCKNWENWKINHNTVQAVQTKVRNYMHENPNLTKLLNGKKKKILYVMPKPILTKSAYAYIKNNQEILDFKIIPM